MTTIHNFNPNVYSFTVNENQATGVVIGQVTVSDADEGSNADIVLDIISGDPNNAFRLDSNNVELNSALNAETQSQYILLIQAVDQGITSNRSSTATVVVDVTPNYAQPRFASTTPSVTITESISGSTQLNTVIYDAQATMNGATEGADPNGDLEYTILSGNDDGKFSINTETGEVLVIVLLDRDTTASYTLTIQAVNRYSTALRDALTLTVTLSDLNDNAPAFSPTSYTFSIDEGVALNTPVGTLTATDTDDGANKVFAYAISSGEGLSDFAIDTSTGDNQSKLCFKCIDTICLLP